MTRIPTTINMLSRDMRIVYSVVDPPVRRTEVRVLEEALADVLNQYYKLPTHFLRMRREVVENNLRTPLHH